MLSSAFSLAAVSSLRGWEMGIPVVVIRREEDSTHNRTSVADIVIQCNIPEVERLANTVIRNVGMQTTCLQMHSRRRQLPLSIRDNSEDVNYEEAQALITDRVVTVGGSRPRPLQGSATSHILSHRPELRN